MYKRYISSELIAVILLIMDKMMILLAVVDEATDPMPNVDAVSKLTWSTRPSLCRRRRPKICNTICVTSI